MIPEDISLSHKKNVLFLGTLIDIAVPSNRTFKVGTVTLIQLITPIPRALGTIALFQQLVEWARSCQKRIKLLRFGCLGIYILFNLGVVYGFVQFVRYAVQSRPGYSLYNIVYISPTTNIYK